MIMDSNIDPAEWRSEVDRVEKLLEIPEYPELLSSQSDSDYLFTLEETNFRKINIFNAFLERQLKNENFRLIENTYSMIEYQLNKINGYESRLRSMKQFKEKVYIFKLVGKD